MAELLDPQPTRTIPQQFAPAPAAPPAPISRQIKPHRANMIITFALIGLFLAPFALAAWIMGSGDLQEMEAGEMDDSGESTTSSARTIGMVITIIWIVVLFFYFVMPS